MKRAGELSGIRPEKSINSKPVDHVAERSDAGVGWVSMCGLRSVVAGSCARDAAKPAPHRPSWIPIAHKAQVGIRSIPGARASREHDFPGARGSSPRAVRGRRGILAMAHRRGNVPDFEGGEIAQSIYLPRVGPRAGSPRSQEVDESRKSRDRTCASCATRSWIATRAPAGMNRPRSVVRRARRPGAVAAPVGSYQRRAPRSMSRCSGGALAEGSRRVASRPRVKFGAIFHLAPARHARSPSRASPSPA